MKVLLVDDEPLARRLLKGYCDKIPEIEIVGECENGFDAVKQIDETKPDLIFLDVQMPKLNGFEVLELLNHRPKVIFSTAFDEYAVKAFDENAVDYLLKPFLFERFEQAYQKCKTQMDFLEKTLNKPLLLHPEENQRIVIKDGDKISILNFGELHYFEAYDDYVKIYANQGRFLKKQTMAYYEKILPNSLFARIHRSYIIAIDKIQRIEAVEKGKYQVRLTNDVCLPISRSAFPELKARLGW